MRFPSPRIRLPLKPSFRSVALLTVSGLHVVMVVGLGLQVIERDHLGGAPVINLTLEPVARFDSDTPPDVASNGGNSGASTAKAAPPAPASSPRLRPAVAPAPAEYVLSIAQQPQTTAPGPDTGETSATTTTVSGSHSSGPPSARASSAGATQGGGARNIGAAAASSHDIYAARVLAWIEQNKRHPGRDRGVVTVSFQLDRQGRVHRLQLSGSSGSRSLDRATLDRISQIQPFPRPGGDVDWSRYPFTVNVDYRNLL